MFIYIRNSWFYSVDTSRNLLYNIIYTVYTQALAMYVVYYLNKQTNIEKTGYPYQRKYPGTISREGRNNKTNDVNPKLKLSTVKVR